MTGLEEAEFYLSKLQVKATGLSGRYVDIVKNINGMTNSGKFTVVEYQNMVYLRKEVTLELKEVNSEINNVRERIAALRKRQRVLDKEAKERRFIALVRNIISKEQWDTLWSQAKQEQGQECSTTG